VPGLDRAAYMKDRWGGLQGLLNRREQRFVARALAAIGPVPRILDLPSGRGRFTARLRAAATAELVCADLDPQRLQALADAEGPAGTPLVLRPVDLLDRLPFADDEFDLVFNFRFLHHVSDEGVRAHVASELARVSRRHLIVSYYGGSPIHGMQRHLWLAASGRRSNVGLISGRRTRDLFAALGCRVVEDRSMLPVLHAHRVMHLEKASG
jgi:SAM-dependent methyltransferase